MVLTRAGSVAMSSEPSSTSGSVTAGTIPPPVTTTAPMPTIPVTATVSSIAPSVQEFMNLAQDISVIANDSDVSNSTIHTPNWSSVTARNVHEEIRQSRQSTQRQENAASINPDLQRIIEHAIELAQVDFRREEEERFRRYIPEIVHATVRSMTGRQVQSEHNSNQAPAADHMPTPPATSQPYVERTTGDNQSQGRYWPQPRTAQQQNSVQPQHTSLPNMFQPRHDTVPPHSVSTPQHSDGAQMPIVAPVTAPASTSGHQQIFTGTQQQPNMSHQQQIADGNVHQQHNVLALQLPQHQPQVPYSVQQQPWSSVGQQRQQNYLTIQPALQNIGPPQQPGAATLQPHYTQQSSGLPRQSNFGNSQPAEFQQQAAIHSMAPRDVYQGTQGHTNMDAAAAESRNFEYRRVDVSKWGLKFDGVSRNLSAEDFIFRVDELRQDYRCTHADVFRGFHHLLTGQALDWYWLHRKVGQISSWPDLKDCFLRQFRRFESEFQIQKKIMDRRQLPQESFESFYNDVIRLRNQQRSPYTDTDLVEIMKSNLKHSLAQLVFPLKIYGLAQFVEEVKKAENLLYNQKQTFPPRSYAPQRVNEIEYDEEMPDFEIEVDAMGFSHYKCWNCQQTGHSFVDCSLPRRLFCWRCGRDNVATRHCPKCQGNLARNSSQTGGARSTPV